MHKEKNEHSAIQCYNQQVISDKLQEGGTNHELFMSVTQHSQVIWQIQMKAHQTMQKQTNFHKLQTMISLPYISSKKIIVLDPGV